MPTPPSPSSAATEKMSLGSRPALPFSIENILASPFVEGPSEPQVAKILPFFDFVEAMFSKEPKINNTYLLFHLLRRYLPTGEDGTVSQEMDSNFADKFYSKFGDPAEVDKEVRRISSIARWYERAMAERQG